MENFHMTDILPLVNLPYPPGGRSSFYVQCPCCDESPRKRHLNINLKKEVFRCPRCGISGGIFDLYALYTGTPREQVRDVLIGRLGTPETVVRSQNKEKTEEKPSRQIVSVDIRHAVYSALLEKLSLAPDHRENLLNRGFTDAQIMALGYKTTPVAGMSAIARQLQHEGYDLAGVPGFYRNNSGSWTFILEKRGIFIPVRDMYGRIQGLQIRRDNVVKRKFRWVSSIGEIDGCGAEGWTHLAGTIRPTMILTEGPMKADVINSLTGIAVLAVPGVNSLTQLRGTLELLREHGLQEIKTAFDMDFVTNPHVQKGYQDLLFLLDELGFRFGCYLWDPQYKGLDDYIWEYCFQKHSQ